MSLDTSSDAHIPAFNASSQFRHWRFTPAQLTDSRHNHNHAAVKVIADNFDREQPGSSTSALFLDAADELLLVRLYVTKIPQLCAAFKFPEEVEATAITFLKRFYLKNTVMDWHPKNVMLTALFLAAKVTNNPIGIDTYTSRIPKTTAADVLDLEFLVAQSLSFEFAVWHAHRALWGIFLDIQNIETTPEVLANIYQEGMTFVRSSRITDAEFIYSPSQIALAAVYSSQPTLAQRWAESKGMDMQLMEKTAGRIVAMVATDGKVPELERVREVDRRLRTCKNPEKTAGTAAYEQRKAEEDSVATEKRVHKALVAQRSMEMDDPFGGNLGKNETKVESE